MTTTTLGKLVVVDGPDGAGKETQTNLLVARLREDGFRVEQADFPQYGKPSAYFVERYLRGEFGTAEEVGPYRASLFYALDRYDASFQIRKWLQEGAIVISNRYVSSNKGHQLGKLSDPEARSRFLSWVNNLEYDLLGVPVPNLTILLHMPAEIGFALVGKKSPRAYIGGADRDIHETDLAHLQNAVQAYLFCAQHDTRENWRVLPCAEGDKPKPITEIQNGLYELVRRELKF